MQNLALNRQKTLLPAKIVFARGMEKMYFF